MEELNTRIIAVANHKGGVGKSSTATTLAAIMFEDGKKVLLVDLDAQSNATLNLCKERPTVSIYNALLGKEDLPIINLRKGENGAKLDLVPSSLQMSWIDLNLASEVAREMALKEVLEPVMGHYDAIILDCPPSLGLITQNAFVAATDVLVPLNADTFSVEGLSMMISFFNMIRKKLNHQLNLLGMLITQYEKNTLTRAVEDSLVKSYGDDIFKTRIRKNVAMGKSQSVKTDLLSYNRNCNAALDYLEFYKELCERLV